MNCFDVAVLCFIWLEQFFKCFSVAALRIDSQNTIMGQTRQALNTLIYLNQINLFQYRSHKFSIVID